MTSVSASQLTLSFEPVLADRFPSLREFIAHRVTVNHKPAKCIAADMDLSPSSLSRNLAPGEADTSRFNVDDLERFIAATGDAPAVIEYLAAKYLGGGTMRERPVRWPAWRSSQPIWKRPSRP